MTSKPGERLGDRRDVGLQHEPLARGDRQAAHAAALDLRERNGPGFHHHVEAATQEVLHNLGVAAVGNAAHGGAGFDVDQLADQVVNAAGRIHPISDGVGRGPGAGDEIAERFYR